MAVKEISGVSHYTGLDTDSKPTTGITPGSVFWQFDPYAQTVTRWMYDGLGWREDNQPNSDGTNFLLGELLIEMAAIRKGMELQIALNHGIHTDLRTEEVSQLQES